VRFAVAKHQGLTEERVALVDDGFEDSALTGPEKATIRMTDVVLAAARLPDALRVDLREHFDDGQVVELAVGVALFMGFSKIAIALGQAPADMPTIVVPTPDWTGSPPRERRGGDVRATRARL
jgi:alkylhydroperoxidase family enzyme